MSQANPERQGKALNDLVAMLERSLIGSEAATVEKNARRKDRDTGRLREHDVIITWQQRHHVIVTAVECRDRTRPVGVPDIEAFAHKCARTGIDHLMIVSSSGFTNSGRAKAAAQSVTLMELSEVGAFDWCQMKFWIEEKREFVGFDSTVFFVNDEYPPGAFTLFDCNRTELTPEHLQATFMGCFDQDPAKREIDVFVPLSLHAQTVDWIAIDEAGIEYRVSHIRAKGGYTVRRTLRPVTMHSYSGPNGSYDIATADFALGAASGKMVMIHDDTGIQVTWEPDR